MPTRLRPEEIVTIAVLDEKGTPKREIARTLGVTEGLVRYHLRRRASGAVDGRKAKPFRAAVVEGQIAAWCAARPEDARPVNVKDLFEHLVEVHQYRGSYRSVLQLSAASTPRASTEEDRRARETPS